MKLKVINIKDQKVDDIELSDKIFKVKPNNELIKSIINWQINHLKPRTAKSAPWLTFSSISRIVFFSMNGTSPYKIIKLPS